ncbi:helix-turn-helix transcriptional regulator [Aureimonas pseudogalii]|uniref:DNA-binding XRE family transcriptional regulator n=1 Tax=Aureimonas pseudogalii TaxID=1744844 RepID=A0A7W6EDY4_9HYPH|nr:helix-turn-helix transcriptional regulator [Aureimonas pseudogalii]MBB3996900.1 DNA-binding XRE family transcriptional regulator [Aureimonas pseudogalii]
MSHSLIYTQRVHSATDKTLVDSRGVYTHHGRMKRTHDTDIRAIGQRLIQTRAALGMSQADFARFLDFSTAALSNYETGLRRPNLDQAFVIVRRTGVTLDWIYFGDRSGLPLRLAEKIPNEADEFAERTG